MLKPDVRKCRQNGKNGSAQAPPVYLYTQLGLPEPHDLHTHTDSLCLFPTLILIYSLFNLTKPLLLLLINAFSSNCSLLHKKEAGSKGNIHVKRMLTFRGFLCCLFSEGLECRGGMAQLTGQQLPVCRLRAAWVRVE